MERTEHPGSGNILPKVALAPPSVHWAHEKRSGSLLLEAMIAIGIFAIFLGGIGLSLILGERSTLSGGDHSRAGFIAEQQLEAVRGMKNDDFDALTIGTYGIALEPDGWTFSGTSVMTEGYEGSITVTSKGTDWLQVDSSVEWDFGPTRSGSVVLHTYLTDWQKPAVVGDWSAMTKSTEVNDGGAPDYQHIAINGQHAFITSLHTAGVGLYIYDISNPDAPVRVASSWRQSLINPTPVRI